MDAMVLVAVGMVMGIGEVLVAACAGTPQTPGERRGVRPAVVVAAASIAVAAASLAAGLPAAGLLAAAVGALGLVLDEWLRREPEEPTRPYGPDGTVTDGGLSPLLFLLGDL